MPPRHASRCCHAVHQRIAAPAEGIWITDTALSSAFERYCIVSRSRRRMASSVPGPLENRRRLGRRQMTELGIQAHPSLPVWALPNAPDLSQWKWLPPTDSSLRFRNQQDEGSQSIPFPSVTLPKWLTELASGGGSLSPPQNGVDAVAQPPRPALATGSRTSRPFFEELEALGQQAVCASEDGRFVLQFREVCKQFQKQLALAAFTTEEVNTALDLLSDTLGVRFPTPAAGEAHYLELYSALVAGVTSCKVLHAGDFGPAFWSRLLLQVAKVSPSEEHLQLLGSILKAIPRGFLAQMAEPIAHSLAVFAACGEVSECDATNVPTVGSLSPERVALGITRSLESLDPKEHAMVLGGTTTLLLGHKSSSSEVQKQTIYRWMTVLAQIRHVDQDHLFDSLSNIFGNSETGFRLRNAELSELLVRQWASRGYLAADILGPFQILGNESDEVILASLALTIFKTAEKRFRTRALYSSLWKCLRVLDRQSDLMHSLEVLVRTRTVPLSFLETLAESSDDIHVAVNVHSIYVRNNKRRAEVQPLWDPCFWERFAGRMNVALDRSLKLEQVFQALDMSSYTSGRLDSMTNKKRKQRKVGASTVALVEQLAVRSAVAADLENRQALRRVEQCRRFLVEHKCALPLAVLKAIYHVITRDLAMAQPGRTSRLRWFLGIIREQYDDQTSLECAAAFRRWRAMIRRYLPEDAGRAGGAKRVD